MAALILAPLTLLLAWLGDWAWLALVAVVSIGLFVEWQTLVGHAQSRLMMAAGAMALLAAAICLGLGADAMAGLALILGIAAAAGLSGRRQGWAALGALYASIALGASILLRRDPAEGFVALMLVLLVVWVTDILGYFCGRGIGGPKLWVRVSPKKTWAGALGGLAGSFAVAGIFAGLELGRGWPLLALAGGLSVVSQLGDLFESAVKRHFGVKDSSHIIPGHGGLLDRLDGFVAAVACAALIGWLRGGIDGMGRGLMVW